MTILCNLRVCLAISRWFDATSLPGSDSIALFRTHSRVFGSPFRLLAAGQTGIDSFTARIARSVWGLAFGKLSLILSQGFEFHRLVFRAQLFTSSMRCCLHSNKKRSKRNSSTPRAGMLNYNLKEGFSQPSTVSPSHLPSVVGRMAIEALPVMPGRKGSATGSRTAIAS